MATVYFKDLLEKMQQGYAVRYTSKTGNRLVQAYKSKNKADQRAGELSKDGAKDISITTHNLNFKEESDHEVSMARGELEAIADKATQLSAALQGKSDEGNPLEAWVQSKITKAKDYINSVSDYMMYKPEEVEEATYGWTLVSKAKDLAKKFKDNITKAVDEIEKLEKGLSKIPTVDAELRKYNESLEEKYTVVITKKDGSTMELGRYNTPAEAQRYVDMYGKGAKVKKEEVELDEID